MLDFVIIADGGGTKTRATGIRSQDGATFEAASGSCVPGVDLALALSSLDDITAQLLQKASVPQGARIGLSLASAGLDNPISRLVFIERLEQRFQAVNVCSDGIAALNACVGSQPGAVIAIGTGVVVAVRTLDGRELLLDGWGWPAGDRGGGAWIGRAAAERFLEAVDHEDIGSDILFDDMSRIMGSERDAISGWLAAATRRDYAAFARTVVFATQKGSVAGHRLLLEAASQVVRMGVVLSERHGINTLFVTGGLAESLTPHLAAERFQLFPDATFAGARLGTAKWFDSSGAYNFQGARHG